MHLIGSWPYFIFEEILMSEANLCVLQKKSGNSANDDPWTERSNLMYLKNLAFRWSPCGEALRLSMYINDEV
jgi:hypothetical protein